MRTSGAPVAPNTGVSPLAAWPDNVLLYLGIARRLTARHALSDTGYGVGLLGITLKATVEWREEPGMVKRNVGEFGR
jgi:hypothetical protein